MNQQNLRQLHFTPDIVKQGLLGEYRFDEQGGAYLRDYSGNENHGILGNSLAPNSNWPIRIANGYFFDFDDLVELPANIRNALSISKEYTIQIVGLVNNFKTTSTFFANTISSSDRMGIGNLTTGIIRYGHYADGNYKTPMGAGINVSQYCHISAGFKNTSELLFNNSLATIINVATSSTIVGCRFGLRTNNDLGLIGVISFALIYSRKLNYFEQQQNYQAIKNIMKKRGIHL